MKKQKLFEAILESLKQGKTTEAEELIKKFAKLRSLYPKDKIKLSEWYLWLGDPLKALKVCGDPLSLNALEVLSVDELCLQIRLGYMLSRVGAKYVGLRHFDNIDKIIIKKNISYQMIYPDIDHRRGYLHLNAYQYDKAKKNFQKALTHMRPNELDYKWSLIGMGDAYCGLGEYEKAVDVANKAIEICHPESDAMLGFCYYIRGEFYFYWGKKEKAREDFDKSWEYYKGKKATKDMSYLARISGALHLLDGNIEQAKKELTMSWEILNAVQSQPITKMANLYWLHKLPGYNLTLGEEVALRAHHCFSPYSFLVGKTRNPENPDPLNMWVSKQYTPSDNDSWIIVDNKIKAINYAYMISSFEGPLMDLYSGVIRNKSGEFEFLTEIEGRCLSAIIGAGDLGIYNWALMDFIYRQNFFTPKNGMDRLKKVIKKLKDKGIKISINQGHYYFEDYSLPIVLSMGLDPKGVWNYFKVHYTEDTFTRVHLESFFNISKASANRWLNEWQEEGVLDSTGVGKAKTYNFPQFKKAA